MKARYDIGRPIVFKKGIYDLNREAHLNYELGRMINWSNGDLAEVQAVSHGIRNFADWKRVLLGLGDRAMKEGRTENAIAYYRMAEFYMDYRDPDALKYYRYAKELFYDYYAGFFEAEEGEKPIIERLEVPYEDTTLPVMNTAAAGEEKGTVLLHGGYDSYMEEFLFPMLYLREKGYRVVLFEGPGQGVMLRERGKCVNWRWEEPVKAILDTLGLEQVIIVGISLGGYYAPRAAAMDKRITAVAEWSAFPSFLDNIRVSYTGLAPALLKALTRGSLGEKLLAGIKKKAAAGNMSAAVFTDAMHKLGADTYQELYEAAAKLDIRPFAEHVTQDVLIMHGDHDVLCNVKMVDIAAALQKNAKSMTVKLLTSRYDTAGDHCNCGNTKLALDTVIYWMDSLRT
ncbi:MAG: alpha/beta hydrolase [Oscillospiraceae bacterium]|nr:alpha/beta hydrolase [Oscillospiraceae bacterium]